MSAKGVQASMWQSELAELGTPRRGKVRDIYDLGEELLIVASDRLSAYDHVLRPAIPDKGKILNQLTNFWFAELADVVANHLLAIDVADFPRRLAPYRDSLRGRAVLVRKARVVPYECVVRGYLAGSALREYQRAGTAGGEPLPAGLARASRLPAPLFTPTTKAETGHDESVTWLELERALGELAGRLRDLTLELFARGRELAEGRGLLLADTKLEFGQHDDELLLIDEVFTPDSSRYWEAAEWRPGHEPASFDKQFVRDWLDAEGWDHESPPPELPAGVVEGTRERYLAAFRRLVGRDPDL